ncbi:hypothetical protein SAMN06265379_1147 [Saccharicrinis carchari]|uniref:Uncharacterized protein n=1 Tax=Saccharicrinis carchari TaxID=1168039 RepID=A0A521F3Y6_SACCC|nr:BfmA/BtgA family mobilization protein [Saccharicrinis carchari]SMO90736.1 hypothetical protein SAMN06265379_1147 [Saccharicrinis carchari]
MSELKNLKITAETKEIIDSLVKNHGGLQRDFIYKMAVYFKNTGTNPDSFLMPSPTEELKKFRDTIIGFMRKQEADYIKPTFGKMQSLMEMMVRLIEEEKSNTEPKVSNALKQNKSLATPSESTHQIPDDSGEIRRLKNQLEIKRQELQTMKKYFLEICDSVEKKSTGMQKKNVILLDEAKFQDSYKWVRTFEI